MALFRDDVSGFVQVYLLGQKNEGEWTLDRFLADTRLDVEGLIIHMDCRGWVRGRFPKFCNRDRNK